MQKIEKQFTKNKFLQLKQPTVILQRICRLCSHLTIWALAFFCTSRKPPQANGQTFSADTIILQISIALSRCDSFYVNKSWQWKIVYFFVLFYMPTKIFCMNFMPCAPVFVKLQPEKHVFRAMQQCEGSLDISTMTNHSSALTLSHAHNKCSLFEQRWYFFVFIFVFMKIDIIRIFKSHTFCFSLF